MLTEEEYADRLVAMAIDLAIKAFREDDPDDVVIMESEDLSLKLLGWDHDRAAWKVQEPPRVGGSILFAERGQIANASDVVLFADFLRGDRAKMRNETEAQGEARLDRFRAAGGVFGEMIAEAAIRRFTAEGLDD